MRPGWGAFVSRDPFEGDPTTPSTRGSHGFARLDPLGFVDPSGNFAVAAASAAISLQADPSAVRLTYLPSTARNQHGRLNHALARAEGKRFERGASALAAEGLAALDRYLGGSADQQTTDLVETWFGPPGQIIPSQRGEHYSEARSYLSLAKARLDRGFRYRYGERGEWGPNAPRPRPAPYPRATADSKAGHTALHDLWFSWPVFGRTQLDSREGILLHEAMHHVGITVDWKYGTAASWALLPTQKLNNADNYKIFAESAYWLSLGQGPVLVP